MRDNSRPAGNAEQRTSVRKNFGFGSRSLTTDGPLTACVLVIGNEILSGKTQDTNLQFLGNELSKLGIQLEEARVVQDEETAIVTAINECRAKYSYVFTTGGIGMVTLGMMARISLWHSGRPLQPPLLTILTFVLLNVSSLLHVPAPVFFPSTYGTLILLSGSVWILAFAFFL